MAITVDGLGIQVVRRMIGLGQLQLRAAQDFFYDTFLSSLQNYRNKDEESIQSHLQRLHDSYGQATALLTLGDRLCYRLHAGTGPEEGWIPGYICFLPTGKAGNFWISEDIVRNEERGT